MQGQKIQGDQLVLDSELKGIASFPRQEFTQVVQLIDDKITYPAKVEHQNINGTDPVLQIYASPLVKKHGTSVSGISDYIYECLPSVSGVFNTYPESFINLTTGSIAGAIDTSSVSGITTTNNYYRWLAIYANSTSGSFGLSLGSESVSAPEFGTLMPSIPASALPLTFVNVHNIGGGAWNFERPDYSSIYNIVRGGIQSTLDIAVPTITQESWTITAPQITFTLTNIVPTTNGLKCYHNQTGQVYTCGVSGMSIAGQNVSFPANSFDYVTPTYVATLVFEQSDISITRISH